MKSGFDVIQLVAHACHVDEEFLCIVNQGMTRAGFDLSGGSKSTCYQAAAMVTAALTSNEPWIARHRVAVYSELRPYSMNLVPRGVAYDSRHHCHPIDAVDIPATCVDWWSELTRDFVSAIAALLEVAAAKVLLPGDARAVMARRSSKAALGIIQLADGLPYLEIERQIVYSLPPDEDEPYRAANARPLTTTSIPGETLTWIGRELSNGRATMGPSSFEENHRELQRLAMSRT